MLHSSIHLLRQIFIAYDHAKRFFYGTSELSHYDLFESYVGLYI
jgi:hypothetical protein